MLNFESIKSRFVNKQEQIPIKPRFHLLNKKAANDTFECSNIDKNIEKKRGKFNKFLDKIFHYNTNCTDGKDDGKLSFKEAAGSFLRGTVNTISNLIDSAIEHPVATTLSVGGTILAAAVITGLGIVSAPALAIGGAAIGIGVGIYNIGKGIYNASKAENDADAKNAFESVGEGTSSAIVSAFFMKKGISDLKEIKQISASAQELAKEASKYADDAVASCNRADVSFENATRASAKASTNVKDADRIFSDTLKIADEAGVSTNGYEIKKASSAFDKIKIAEDTANQTIESARQALNEVHTSTIEAVEHSKTAQQNAQNIRKAASVKKAKAFHQATAQSAENAKIASESASLNADLVENSTNNLLKLASESDSSIKDMCSSFIKIDSNISGFDYYSTEYVDDRVAGYDFSGVKERTDIRTKVEMQSGLRDKELEVLNLDKGLSCQLNEDSKYFELGTPRKTNKGKYIFICDNLRDTPDGNGLRGKTPLSGKKGEINWRLSRVKQAGINTVIDLRSEGECSSAAHQVLSDLGMNYVNFPVEDSNWSLSSLDKITEFIKTVNEGDFYVGCANGESRTDLAIAINYFFNPEAKVFPKFYYSSASSTRVSVERNINMIMQLISSNQDIVKDWGWNSYDDFISAFKFRFGKM